MKDGVEHMKRTAHNLTSDIKQREPHCHQILMLDLLEQKLPLTGTFPLALFAGLNTVHVLLSVFPIKVIWLPAPQVCSTQKYISMSI
jgi:hypothetical protein